MRNKRNTYRGGPGGGPPGTYGSGSYGGTRSGPPGSYGRSKTSGGGVGVRIRRPQRESLSIILLLLSAGTGLLMWLIGEKIYAANAYGASMPLLIGTEFGLLALAVGVVVLIVSVFTGLFTENPFTGGGVGITAAMLIAGVILVAALGALFQWIYGMSFGQAVTNCTSYVFVVDDSASTASTDPAGKRYLAIPQVLSDMPEAFPYSVYSFSDDVYELRAMAPRSEGNGSFEPMTLGGTAIKTALDAIICAYEAGEWSGGDAPKVILMSDGYATDVGLFHSELNNVLRKYAKNGVSISTVGLSEADERLMSKIARSTGGVFLNVDDASQLSSAMATAATHYSSRDLLSTRFSSHLGFLFGLMRVVFIGILGTLIGIIAWLASGATASMNLTLVSSAVKSLIGALAMEIFSSLSVMSDQTLWLILWVLIAATLATDTRVFGGTQAQINSYGTV